MARKLKLPESGRMAKAVGREVRKLRTASGLSQEALADAVGVHRTQIGFVERGENTTSIHTLALLAKALGTKASAILKAIDA